MKFFFRVLLSTGALVAILCVIHPELNKWTRSFFTPAPYRKVLATASGDLLNVNTDFKVIKVRSHNGLFIEVYKGFRDNTRPRLSRIKLPDKRDGYFYFQGQATNLAIEDLDGDKKLEIIAPSFDENLRAHLNIFKYNETTHNYEIVKDKSSLYP